MVQPLQFRESRSKKWNYKVDIDVMFRTTWLTVHETPHCQFLRYLILTS